MAIYQNEEDLLKGAVSVHPATHALAFSLVRPSRPHLTHRGLPSVCRRAVPLLPFPQELGEPTRVWLPLEGVSCLSSEAGEQGCERAVGQPAHELVQCIGQSTQRWIGLVQPSVRPQVVKLRPTMSRMGYRVYHRSACGTVHFAAGDSHVDRRVIVVIFLPDTHVCFI